MSSHVLCKPSFFNITIHSEDDYILFNSLTGQALHLNKAQWGVLENCFSELEQNGACQSEELLEGLAQLGFVVPIDRDEYQCEKERYLNNQHSTRILYLTIAPTMQCNVKCSYCFQQNLPRTRAMTTDIQRGIVEFVRRKAKGTEGMVVQWFGGEPLMAYGVIKTLTTEFQRICADSGLHYRAEMMTNGLLLTPEIIRALPTLSVNALQIPLDGSPASYAERRQMSLQRAEAHYRFLVENMQSMVDGVGSITIRINVDKDNIQEARDVVQMFKRHGVTDQRIDFRLGFLDTSHGVTDCIPHDCFTGNEFTEAESDFRYFLAQEDYKVYGMPQPVNYPCGATIRNNYTFDPSGNIGKCVPETGTDLSVFAHIYADDIDRTMAEIETANPPYGDFDPFASASCSDCKLLPVCLGLCPKLHRDGCLASSCRMKDGLEDKMVFYGKYYHGLELAAVKTQ
jgi:uncharacterized protein